MSPYPAIDYSVFDRFTELRTPRLLLRAFTPDDTDAVFRMRSDERVVRYIGRDPQKSPEEATDWIRMIQENHAEKRGISWAVVHAESQKLVGDCAIWRLIPEHCRAEIGYGSSPEFWGQGLMREAVGAMVRFGFSRMCLHSLEANVDPENIASIRLLEGIGFRREAHFRENFLFKERFLDSYIYSLLEKDLPENQLSANPKHV